MSGSKKLEEFGGVKMGSNKMNNDQLDDFLRVLRKDVDDLQDAFNDLKCELEAWREDGGNARKKSD